VDSTGTPQAETQRRTDVGRKDVRNARNALAEMIQRRAEWKAKARGRSKPLREIGRGRVTKGEGNVNHGIDRNDVNHGIDRNGNHGSNNDNAFDFADESESGVRPDGSDAPDANPNVDGNTGPTTSDGGGVTQEYFCMSSQRRAQTATIGMTGRRSYQVQYEVV
jgi:hypothetical protein